MDKKDVFYLPVLFQLLHVWQQEGRIRHGKDSITIFDDFLCSNIELSTYRKETNNAFTSKFCDFLGSSHMRDERKKGDRELRILNYDILKLKF